MKQSCATRLESLLFSERVVGRETSDILLHLPVVDLGPEAKKRKMWLSNLSVHRIHDQYAGVLRKVNDGVTILDALKLLGMARSTFYKWKPVAELKILDPQRFHHFQETYQSDSVLVLAACKTAMSEHRLSSRARELRTEGKIISDLSGI